MLDCDNEIKVSVCCAVYNHEKYLRKCLEGFIMQKTNFKYEVLVHDDASTDNSADIIREYEKKYPEIIKPIYQEENQYSKGKMITWEFQYPRAKGVYVALCEGDDYWCDENKLQMQYDMMESQDGAVICTHRVERINEDGSTQNLFFPEKEIEQVVLTSKEMIEVMCEQKYPFQTSSYFFKKKTIYKVIQNMPKFLYRGGDLMLLLYFISEGDFIYIHKTMSHYRYQSLGSWSERNKSISKQIPLVKNTIATYLLYDIYTNQMYSSTIQKIIEREHFYMCLLEEDYQSICSRRYRWIMKSIPMKRQFYYQICAKIPVLKKIYRIIKKKDEK